MGTPIQTPDIYIYSDTKKNRKVGSKKGSKSKLPKYQPTEQDKTRSASLRKRV